MNSRLGIVLSAVFLVFVCGMTAPAQASPLRIGAASACAAVPARHNSPQTPVTNTSLADSPQQGRVIPIPTKPESLKLLQRVDPKHPSEAKAKGIQGAVQLSALIGKDGHVKKLRAMSGPPILVKAAESAVRQWVYQPTLLNGKPVEVETDITIRFKLPSHPKAKESQK